MHPKVRVETIINHIPGWQDIDDIIVEKIGGLTNSNFKVTVNGNHFVLRVSGGNTHYLGIDRQLELDALRVASAHDLAPEIFHYFKPDGHLVTRWIDGRHWTYNEYCQPKNLRRIVEAVKEIHNLPPIQGEVSPFRRIKQYLIPIQKFNVSIPNGFDKFVTAMEKIESSLVDDPFPARRFCHNDLFSYNFIDDGKIRFLDWEFAGMGNIFYDLATLAHTFDSVGEIPAELQNHILSFYFGDVTNYHKMRFEQMKFMVLFYAAMWGMLQYGLQQNGIIDEIDDFNCLTYAHEMFTMIKQSKYWQNQL